MLQTCPAGGDVLNWGVQEMGASRRSRRSHYAARASVVHQRFDNTIFGMQLWESATGLPLLVSAKGWGPGWAGKSLADPAESLKS